MEDPAILIDHPSTRIFRHIMIQVCNGIDLDTVGLQFEPYRWRRCGVTWDVIPEQSW